MGKKKHAYLDKDFEEPNDECFAELPFPEPFESQYPTKDSKCFSCNHNFNKKRGLHLHSREKKACPLCGGVFCSRCLKYRLNSARLFPDGSQEICSCCYERFKKKQEEIKSENKNSSKHTISGPTFNASSQNNEPTPLSSEVLNSSLEKFMIETNVPEAKRDTLRSFPDDKKWTLIQSYQQQQLTSQTTDSPSTHINQFDKTTAVSAQSLRLALSSATLSWIEQFISLNGISLLLNTFTKFLDLENKEDSDHLILKEFISCFFYIANIQVGFKALLDVGSVETLVQSLGYFDGKEQVKLLELLAGMALISTTAHEDVLTYIDPAMPCLLDILTSSGEDIFVQKEAVLTFFNALITRMEDAKSSTFRKEHSLDIILSLMSSRPSSKELHTQIDTYQTVSGATKAMPIYSVNNDENMVVQKCKELTGQLLGFDSLLPILSTYFDHLTYLPRSGDPGVSSWTLVSNCIQIAARIGPLSNEKELSQRFIHDVSELYDLSVSTSTIVPAANIKEAETPVAPPAPIPAPPPAATPPPPPPGGIPAPPGGVPGAPSLGGTPKKALIKPNIKMRKFNWTKISYRNAQNTFWENVDESHIDVHVKQVESIFGIVKKTKTGAVKEVTKPKTIHLLDTRRSQNMSIVLSRYSKIPLQQVADAVLYLDEKFLLLDNAVGLLNSCPTTEEIEMLQDFKGEHALLDIPEKYVLLVAAVPRYRERLESMVTKLTFTPRLQSTHGRLQLMDNSLQQIQSNSKFHQLLTLVLAVGNYMNGNTITGGSFGFRLTSLPKMIDCRSPAYRKVTLLHYCVRLILDDYADILDIPSQLSLVNQAAKFDIGPIMKELNGEIAPSIVSLKAQIALAVEKGDTVFQSTFAPFYEEAVEKLNETKEVGRNLVKHFGEFVAFFAEDKKLTFKELLLALDIFLAQFKRAIEDNMTFKKKQLKKQQLQDIELAKDERGLLDSALGNLRSGAHKAI